MQKDKFTEQFRSKLTDYEWEGTVPDWSEIEHRLPQSASRFLFWRIAAAVVLLGSCGWLGWYASLSGVDPEPVFTHQQITQPASSETSSGQPLLADITRQEIPVSESHVIRKHTELPVNVYQESVTRTGDTGELLSEQVSEQIDTPQSAGSVDEQSDLTPEQHYSGYDKSSDDYSFRNQTARKQYPVMPKRNRHRKTGIGLIASNFSTSPKTSSSNSPMMSSTFRPVHLAIDADGHLYRSQRIRQVSNFRHNLPVRAGLSVGYEVLRNLSVESGLIYSYHHSEFGRVDDTAVDGIQKLHFLGVPLNLNYQVYHTDLLRFYVGIGGEIDFNLSASQRFSMSGQQIDSYTRQKEPILGCGAKIGMACRIIKSLELYVEPALMKYWSDGEFHTRWTDDKQVINLNFGLRSLF